MPLIIPKYWLIGLLPVFSSLAEEESSSMISIISVLCLNHARVSKEEKKTQNYNLARSVTWLQSKRTLLKYFKENGGATQLFSQRIPEEHLSRHFCGTGVFLVEMDWVRHQKWWWTYKVLKKQRILITVRKLQHFVALSYYCGVCTFSLFSFIFYIRANTLLFNIEVIQKLQDDTAFNHLTSEWYSTRMYLIFCYLFCIWWQTVYERCHRHQHQPGSWRLPEKHCSSELTEKFIAAGQVLCKPQTRVHHKYL